MLLAALVIASSPLIGACPAAAETGPTAAPGTAQAAPPGGARAREASRPGGVPATKPGAGGRSKAPAPAIAFLPTIVIEGGTPRLLGKSEPDVLAPASGLAALLTDTAQDLGLTVDLTYRAPATPRSERELVAQARAMGGILVSPSVEIHADGDVEIRLILADARSSALRVRVDRVARDDVAVRAVVMLRDLVTEIGGAAPPARVSQDPAGASAQGVLATPAPSAGRATLAIHATLWGGFMGFSIHRSSGSDDPRLLYPLLAVGAGIGLGGAVLVAEEWDVGVADAWYLASGVWWPTIGAHLLYEGRFADHPGSPAPDEERWAFGIVGGAAGLTLATLGLALHGMDEGGALLAHSGGGLGLMLGGLTELAVRGDIYRVPFAGMGYGAGLGWLAAAATATLVDVSPSRVLSIDLGGLVGGLGGAALASPLLFNEPSANKQRAWLGVTAGGSLLGAGVAWYMTRAPQRGRAPAVIERAGRRSSSPMRPSFGVPTPGIVGTSVAVGRRAPAPVLGVLWQGMLP